MTAEIRIRNRTLTFTPAEGAPASESAQDEVFGHLYDSHGRRVGTVVMNLWPGIIWPNGTRARLDRVDRVELDQLDAILGTRRMIGLPAWDEMCELDRGAALLHVWKLYWEGGSYAREHYSASYLVDEHLVALPAWKANRHARTVAGSWRLAEKRLGMPEVERLYGLALDEERRRAGLPLSSIGSSGVHL